MNSPSRSPRRAGGLCLCMMILALSALPTHARAADGKQPITHEALWLMPRVGPPALSPNGKWVVFPMVEPAYDAREQTVDLWIVPSDGSAPARRLTFSKAGEGNVTWSPDSRRLAFVARREGDEAPQIYILDLAAGGEAIRFTNLSTGARAPRWSPSGDALLFTSSVYPGAKDDETNKKIAAERKSRKNSARVYSGFPVRMWDHWRDDMQSHVFVQSLEKDSKPRDLLAGSSLVSGAGFGGRPSLSGDELDAVWAPDGRSIVFVATTEIDKSAYAEFGTHLYKVSVDGGEPQVLTRMRGAHSQPKFHPGGRELFFSFSASNDKVYNLERVAKISWPSGDDFTLVTGGLDRSVSTFDFTSDGNTIYLSAEDRGLEKIYSVPATGGRVQPVFEMREGAYLGLTVAGSAAETVIVAGYETAISPPEIVRIDPRAGGHKNLTSFCAERAARIDWLPLRHFTFRSKRGRQIHSMLALPPGFNENGKYPLLVLMHGGPHSMWRDQFVIRWNYHLLAQPGYVVLLTNYTGSTGFGEKFAQDIQLDPFKGPAEEVNEAADEAIRLFSFIDGSRQAAAGASYGGHLANWMQATTTRYRCLISHAGLINLESMWGTSDVIYHREVNNGGPVWEQGPVWKEQNPARFAARFRTPILLTAGENDFRVPINQTLENWSLLQRRQVPSRLIVFPDENHWILKGENSRFFYQEVHAWLEKHLK